jgi:hypothetical protein
MVKNFFASQLALLPFQKGDNGRAMQIFLLRKKKKHAKKTFQSKRFYDSKHLRSLLILFENTFSIFLKKNFGKKRFGFFSYF